MEKLFVKKGQPKKYVFEQNLIESGGDKVLLTKDGWKVPEENTGGNGTIVLDESSTVFDISEHFDSSTTESPSTSDKNNRRGH